MTSSDDHQDLSGIEDRLRRSRAELTPIELDEMKRQALSRASTGGRMNLKSRAVTALLVLGLVGSGGGAVLAASGGNGKSNGNGADRSQYCPPNSPGAGKPKDPRPAKCGHPEGSDESGASDAKSKGKSK
jgi:hypothetical protein